MRQDWHRRPRPRRKGFGELEDGSSWSAEEMVGKKAKYPGWRIGEGV